MRTEHDDALDTIHLPCVSVWSVCALANGDLAVGCDDATARIFTRTDERAAPAGTQPTLIKAIKKMNGITDVLVQFDEQVQAYLLAKQSSKVRHRFSPS